MEKPRYAIALLFWNLVLVVVMGLTFKHWLDNAASLNDALHRADFRTAQLGNIPLIEAFVPTFMAEGDYAAIAGLVLAAFLSLGPFFIVDTLADVFQTATELAVFMRQGPGRYTESEIAAERIARASRIYVRMFWIVVFVVAYAVAAYFFLEAFRFRAVAGPDDLPLNRQLPTWPEHMAKGRFVTVLGNLGGFGAIAGGWLLAVAFERCLHRMQDAWVALFAPAEAYQDEPQDTETQEADAGGAEGGGQLPLFADAEAPEEEAAPAEPVREPARRRVRDWLATWMRREASAAASAEEAPSPAEDEATGDETAGETVTRDAEAEAESGDGVAAAGWPDVVRDEVDVIGSVPPRRVRRSEAAADPTLWVTASGAVWDRAAYEAVVGAIDAEDESGAAPAVV